YIRLSRVDGEGGGSRVYRLRVEDNGCGVPPEHIPAAFGQILYGSKYRLRQTRGMFGLGGAMTLLYGQITTHKPVYVASSTGETDKHEYKLMIDIQRNKPIILHHKVLKNDGWRGTVIDFYLEGDYPRAMPKVLEYLKQTALVNPYANITFVDPKGRLYMFLRATKKMPPPPREIKPHPVGVDVEMLRRIIRITKCKNMVCFMRTHFHRVGKTTAIKFLKFAGIDPKTNPKDLQSEDIVRLVRSMKRFKGFLSPDASCLSPLGEELLKTGIIKELEPEFVAVCQRKPSSYGGHPFIVEVAIAYGGNIPRTGDINLYRFANKIPLLYDEASDVSWRVIKSINWRQYKVSPDMPVLVVTHICSTKVPYKTVGKEFVADIPEVRREIELGIREVARKLGYYLSKKEKAIREQKRLGVFAKYLPKIAEFSSKLVDREPPDIEVLLRRIGRFEPREISREATPGEQEASPE
ncbi:MAG TPA: DNA topoisomerase VI subunit B, partial [Candidatus Bathyarchaeota archaeon]|nr:DNA topoisomerase VI subunit B [Candidatus Bathyarchaeota archaeon]